MLGKLSPSVIVLAAVIHRMKISIQCPNAHALRVPAKLCGKEIACPACGESFFVPNDGGLEWDLLPDAALPPIKRTVKKRAQQKKKREQAQANDEPTPPIATKLLGNEILSKFALPAVMFVVGVLGMQFVWGVFESVSSAGMSTSDSVDVAERAASAEVVSEMYSPSPSQRIRTRTKIRDLIQDAGAHSVGVVFGDDPTQIKGYSLVRKKVVRDGHLWTEFEKVRHEWTRQPGVGLAVEEVPSLPEDWERIPEQENAALVDSILRIHEHSVVKLPSVGNRKEAEIAKLDGPERDVYRGARYPHLWSPDGRWLYLADHFSLQSYKTRQARKVRANVLECSLLRVDTTTWRIRNAIRVRGSVHDLTWSSEGLIVQLHEVSGRGRRELDGQSYVVIGEKGDHSDGIAVVDPVTLQRKAMYHLVADQVLGQMGSPIVFCRLFNVIASFDVRTGSLLDMTDSMYRQGFPDGVSDFSGRYYAKLYADGGFLRLAHGFGNSPDSCYLTTISTNPPNQLRVSKKEALRDSVRDPVTFDQYLAYRNQTKLKFISTRQGLMPRWQTVSLPGEKFAVCEATKFVGVCGVDPEIRALYLRMLSNTGEEALVLDAEFDLEAGRDSDKWKSSTEQDKNERLAKTSVVDFTISPDGRGALVVTHSAAYWVEFAKQTAEPNWVWNKSSKTRPVAEIDAPVLIYAQHSGITSTGVHLKGRYFATTASIGDLSEAVGERDVKVVLHSGLMKQKILVGKVIRTDPVTSLSLVEVESDVDLPDLPDTVPQGLKETQALVVHGFPQEQVQSERRLKFPRKMEVPGTITSLRRSGSELRLIQYEGDLDTGFAGAPVRTADGQLVGLVNSGIINADLIGIVPLNQVQRLLAPYASFVAPQLAVEDLDTPLEFSSRIRWVGLNSSEPLSVELEVSTGDTKSKRYPLQPAGDQYTVSLENLKELVGDPQDPVDLEWAVRVKRGDTELSTEIRRMRLGEHRPFISRFRMSTASKTEKMDFKIDDVVVGGRGRWLVLHSDTRRSLYVFDVCLAKIVAKVPLESRSAMFEAGREHLVVLDVERNYARTWSFPEGKFVAERKLELNEKAELMAIGCNSLRGVLKTRSDWWFIDIATLELTHIDKNIKTTRYSGLEIQTSATGNLLAIRKPEIDPKFVELVNLEDDAATSTEIDRISSGRVILDSTGSFLHTKSMVYTSDLRSFRKDSAKFSIPSHHGQFEIGDLKGETIIYNRAAEIAFQVSDVKLEPLFTESEKLNQKMKPEDRIHIIPEAGLLALIPTQNDRVVLYTLPIW